MNANLSVAQILANLELQMEHHRGRSAQHAERESFHRGQREAHDAELEAVTRQYQAFKAVAGTAVEMASRTAATAGAQGEETLPAGASLLRSRLVARVIAGRPADEPFTASSIAEEVNRRFRKSLKKPANSRLAAAAIRRMMAHGLLSLAQKGAPHHEAVYIKVVRGEASIGEGSGS